MSIQWNDSYNIGIKVIDEQHRRFIEMLEELSEALANGSTIESMQKLFGEIEKYAEMHFSLEEKYFEEYEYENKEEHEAEHQIFRDNVQSLKKELDDGEVTFLEIRLLDLMESWFFHHIQGEDKKYVQCFRDHGME